MIFTTPWFFLRTHVCWSEWWLFSLSLSIVFCPLEPSTPFVSRNTKSQGLLVFFPALSPCLALSEGFASTWVVTGGWAVHEGWTRHWQNWSTGIQGFKHLGDFPPYCSSVIHLRVWPRKAFIKVLSHLPQATSETLAPHSSATMRGLNSFWVELWPSWPAPPAPKVNTKPSL